MARADYTRGGHPTLSRILLLPPTLDCPNMAETRIASLVGEIYSAYRRRCRWVPPLAALGESLQSLSIFASEQAVTEEHGVESEQWYYSVEVRPGVYTHGRDHANISVTRALLRGVTWEGHECLDIGTQEGLIPTLLRRGAARRVVAYDVVDRSPRIELLRATYGADFEYVAGMPLHRLPPSLDARGGRFFDLVVFSGVLYHVINPLGALATVRGLCKPGGLLLVETAAIQHEEPKLILNAAAKTYGHAVQANYFIASTTWLDYALRMLGLRPLAVRYIGSSAPSSINRVAVLCRSEPRPCPLDPSDDWATAPSHWDMLRDEAEVDWETLLTTSSEIAYVPGNGAVACDDRTIFDAVRTSSPYQFTLEECRLSLDSTM